MKIFLTFSWGDSTGLVEKNFDLAASVFKNIEKIEGKNTIVHTYFYLSSLANGPFVWIDSDNEVKPESIQILEHKKPSIMMSINEYGIVYGHGGIKLCNPFLSIRDNAIDVTHYLQLAPINIIGSFHSLGDGWLKYRSIFVEMIKCSLRNDLFILNKWKSVRPDIWIEVEKLLKTSTIDTILDLIRNRKSFETFYENSVCINLQK
jgi:hypothetical protein